jgi:hypothetical protein
VAMQVRLAFIYLVPTFLSRTKTSAQDASLIAYRVLFRTLMTIPADDASFVGDMVTHKQTLMKGERVDSGEAGLSSAAVSRCQAELILRSPTSSS